MWYLNKIPKLCNFYFGGKMPYLRYLSIKSFVDHNPDWDVRLFFPKHLTEEMTWVTHEHKYQKKYDDCFDKLADLDIELIELDMEDWDISNNISEVHKADLARWKLLSEGGVFSETDIIYFDSMENISVNNDFNETVDTVLCFGRNGHNAGLLMSSVGNPVFENLLNLSFRDYNPDHYSGIGVNLMNRTMPFVDDDIANLPTSEIYSVDVKDVYGSHTKPKFALHWNASHPLAGQYLNKTNGGKKKKLC